MITFRKALTEILSFAKPVKTEKIAVTDSYGRILSSDIIAPISIPTFDNSAMDGYAARSSDLKKVPLTLKVVEIIQAGSVPRKTVRRGECAKIMTGAPMPSGADCVIMVEDTKMIMSDGHNPEVMILKRVKKWENVRFAGEDIKKGTKVLSAGQVVTPSVMGVLSSVGLDRVEVYKKVKVGFLTTGDEIIHPPKVLKRGQIYNSNRYTLLGAINSCGAEPVYMGHIRDNLAAIADAVKKGVMAADIIVSSGGVSMGDYDAVKKAFESLGAKIKFWKVAMKPGRPNVFAVLNGKPVFGLPGNPVSTLLSFELMVKPAIYRMSGRKDFLPETFTAKSNFKFSKNDRRQHFLRAILSGKKGEYAVKLTGPQGSAILTSVVKADCLVVVPEGKVEISKDSTVEVLRTGKM